MGRYRHYPLRPAGPTFSGLRWGRLYGARTGLQTANVRYRLVEYKMWGMGMRRAQLAGTGCNDNTLL